MRPWPERLASASSATWPHERGPVPDDVLDGHAADDGAEGSGEHFLGEADDAVLLLQESLRRRADRVLAAADLDDRDAFEVGLHAAQGDRAAHGDGDVPAGEVQGELLLDERHDEDAAPDDDLLTAVVDAGAAGHRVGGLLAATPRDDEGLAGPRDLVPRDHGERQEHEKHDDPDDGDHYWTHEWCPPCPPDGTAVCAAVRLSDRREARWCISVRRGGP